MKVVNVLLIFYKHLWSKNCCTVEHIKCWIKIEFHWDEKFCSLSSFWLYMCPFEVYDEENHCIFAYTQNCWSAERTKRKIGTIKGAFNNQQW